jgi:hypothetical protein
MKPNFEKAYFFRALSEVGINKKEEACKDFAKAKELNYSKADELIKKYCN